MDHTVPLRENYAFKRLYRGGVCHVTPQAAIYVKKNRARVNRLGITASKKIGNAVERNRARRILKEAYRLLEPGIPAGYDIVLVARKKTVYVKMQAVKAVLDPVLTGL